MISDNNYITEETLYLSHIRKNPRAYMFCQQSCNLNSKDIYYRCIKSWYILVNWSTLSNKKKKIEPRYVQIKIHINIISILSSKDKSNYDLVYYILQVNSVAKYYKLRGDKKYYWNLYFSFLPRDNHDISIKNSNSCTL